MYENGKMRPVETIPGMREGGQRRMMGGVESTMIYFKNICKCHNVPPVQQKKNPSHTVCPHEFEKTIGQEGNPCKILRRSVQAYLSMS
jgi:hypothetical protein